MALRALLLCALLPRTTPSTPTLQPTTDEACPAPTSLDCAGGLRSSVMIAASESGALRESCPGTARFLRPDPLTGAVLEICGSHPNGTRTAPRSLPVSDCGEAHIGGIAVDHPRREAYYTTGGALRKLGLDAPGDAEVAAALGVVVVRGQNFGKDADDLRNVALRGLDCPRAALTWVSEFEVRCVVSDPSLAGPRASELRPSCVAVTTKSGGAGSSESRTTAEYRRAEYGAAAGPAVFEVEVLNGGGFALRARAVAVDESGPRVFFSSLGSDDGDVYGGVLVYENGALAVALDDAPRVHGLAFEADAGACGGGWLYYADAARSLIARRPACPASYGAPGDAHERVLASGLSEPRGLALDPHVEKAGDARALYATANTRVVRLDASGTDSFDVVHAGMSHSAPDGILVLPLAPGKTSSRGDRSLRLLWLDANKPGVRAATAAGTRPGYLPTPPDPLRFPRALALDPADGELLIGEWLGRIWKAPPSMAAALLLRDDDTTAAAASVRATLDDEERSRARLQTALYTLLKL